MVFALPRLPSFTFDTSPPVVYDNPRYTPRSRSRSSTASAAGHTGSPTPAPSRGSVLGGGGGGGRYDSESPRLAIPFPRLGKQRSCHDTRGGVAREREAGEGRRVERQGGLLHPSVSSNDLRGVWEPLPGGGLGERRGSANTLGGAVMGARAHGEEGITTRPRHTRSQSALPLPPRSLLPQARPSLSHSTSSASVGPQNKLQEFSRNPLASASATNLPTLAEMEMDMGKAQENGEGDVGVSASGPVTSGEGRGVMIPPPSMLRPRNRASRASSIISSAGSTPPSPTLHEARPRSFVPPPQPAPVYPHNVSASMPPPPLRPSASSGFLPGSRVSRPPASPRAHSYLDTRGPGSGMHSRKGSISEGSVEVSDVAVLATWSFPASPSPEKKRPESVHGAVKEKEGEHGEDDVRGRAHGMSVKERLQSISRIDTFCTPPPGASAPGTPRSTTSARSSSTATSGNTVIRPSLPLPSHLTSRHRHTHSSPNLLLRLSSPSGSPSSVGSMGPPPPPPKARRQTTRIRNPNPLAMHGSSAPAVPPSGHGLHRGSSLSGKLELGSSPGSMISDATTCPSPTSSVRSLPLGPAPSIHLHATDGVDGAGEGRWWTSIPSFRGRSKSCASEISVGAGAEAAVEAVSARGSGKTDEGLGVEVEDEHEEEYIDMEHM
ncbi:hypothetical protein IAT38_006378 [Cryptococcus sp. DSM 104549]